MPKIKRTKNTMIYKTLHKTRVLQHTMHLNVEQDMWVLQYKFTRTKT
jgi:hypothetical protein